MKLFFTFFVFTFMFTCLTVTSGQISEEIELPTLEGSTDSSFKSNENRCIPPCRKGFFCFEGQCISKCNPPCSDGMNCWDDGECHPQTTTIKKALAEIDEISRVFAKEELVQGTVIQTNNKNSRVRILDTTFEFKGELYLNVPNGIYDVFVDAHRRFVNQEDLEVRLGTIDTLEVKLWPFQINAGFALGGSSMKEFSLLAGEAYLGIGLFSLANVGLTGTYVGPVDVKMTNVTKYDVYWNVPDTLKEVWTELIGMGVSCGYLGINPIAQRIKFIPQIAFGFWKYDDQT